MLSILAWLHIFFGKPLSIPDQVRGRLFPGHDLALQPRHDFHMRGIAKLIDRRDRAEPVTGLDQGCRIARKCRGIARYRNDHGHAARRQFARLRLCALARRIEDDRVEAFQLGRDQWPAEQVTPLGLDRLEALNRGSGALERGERGFVVVDGGDACPLGEPQREWADAGEQVGDFGRVAGRRQA